MKRRAGASFLQKRWGIIITLVVISLFFGVASPYYFTFYNFLNILNHTTITLILAIGMVFVIAPLPNEYSRPVTVDAWHSRAQWSTLFV